MTMGQSCLPGSVGPDIIVTAQFGGGSSSVATGQFAPPSINLGLGLGLDAANAVQQRGTILQQKGRRNSVGKRGEAGQNPNDEKHGPRRAFGRPGYVVDTDRTGRKGVPRPARQGEPGYGEGVSNFSGGDALLKVGAVVILGGAAIILAPEIAAALAIVGAVSAVAN